MGELPTKRFDRNFDVGGRGITGHYDTMLGKFQQNSSEAIFTLAVWAWVATWPPGAVFFKLGPVLTLAFLIKARIALWTLRIWWPIVVGLWYAWRWQRLERRGLLIIVRNDHILRVVFYRRKDNQLLYDSVTQAQRFSQEVSVNHRRRDKLAGEGRKLLIELGRYALWPIGYFLFPVVVGHHVMELIEHIWRYVTLDQGITWIRAHSVAVDNDTARQVIDALCAWLMRPDVHAVLTGYDWKASILWYLFLTDVVPVLCAPAWTLFDGLVHHCGCQYVPGAKVLEGFLSEKTLDTMRGEKIHGNVEPVAPAEAARQMSAG